MSLAVTFTESPDLKPRDRCWRCDQARAGSDIGLCGECRDRLIDEGGSEQ